MAGLCGCRYIREELPVIGKTKSDGSLVTEEDLDDYAPDLLYRQVEEAFNVSLNVYVS